MAQAGFKQHVSLDARAVAGSLPKAIHLRLSQEALEEIIKSKGQSNVRIALSETGTSATAIKIGDSIHSLHSVKEDQPHQVYRSIAGSNSWQLQGNLTERLLLESDVSDRLRQRTEAAVAEKTDRHIVVLQGDPHAAHKSKGKSPLLQGPSSLSSFSTAPTRKSVSPAPSNPRPTPRLVVPPIRPKLPDATQTKETAFLGPAPRQHDEPSPSSDSAQEAVVRNPTRQQQGDDSLDSASSSTGTTFNFSSGASASSRTSVSSGDSPPFKDSMHVDVAQTKDAPRIAILSATPVSQTADLSALGFSVPTTTSTETDVEMAEATQIKRTPSSSSADSSRPLAAVAPSSQSKSQPPVQYYNPIAPPPPAAPPNKRARGDFESSSAPSSSDDRSISRSPRPNTKPQANARTAGGARFSRPAKKLSPSTSPDPDSGANTPVPSAIPKDRFLNVTPASSPNPDGKSKKRKSELVEQQPQDPPKKKKKPAAGIASSSSMASKRNAAHYTSSESESEAPLSAKPSTSAAAVSKDRGRTATAKPLRPTAVASLVKGDESRANTPQQQWTASPAQSSSAIMQIASQSDYEQQHARFALLQKDLEKLCLEMRRHQKLLRDFIKGKDISEGERMAIPSKKEAETLSQRAAEAHAELNTLKQGLWNWARARQTA